MPVGISFYTFKAMSYVFDIYLCKMPPVRSFLDVMLYVSFFPQIASGPIVHAADFFPQIEPATTGGQEAGSKPIEFDRALGTDPFGPPEENGVREFPLDASRRSRVRRSFVVPRARSPARRRRLFRRHLLRFLGIQRYGDRRRPSLSASKRPSTLTVRISRAR